MKILLTLLSMLLSCYSTDNWKELAPGLEYRVLSVNMPEYGYPVVINAVRIDPQKWELAFRGISQETDGEPKTAREWCSTYNLTAAINAGMYNNDFRTHTGYLRDGEHVNSDHVNIYKSALAFNPKAGRDVPPVRIFDLDQPSITVDSIQNDYGTVIQNLRLIKRPGVNVWSQRQDIWSEAALAEDKQGRIIFLISEAPVSMYDFNEILLGSDLEIVAAQHLEGNAPAQLYLKTGATEIILSGEPGFELPMPNVLGIRRRINPDDNKKYVPGTNL